MPLPNLDDVPTLELATDGQHELEIARAKEFTSQNGRLCWRVTFRVTDEDTAEDFTDIVAFPDENDDTKLYRRMATNVRNFMECFGLSQGDEADDAVGCTGNAVLGSREDDYNGGQKNVIRKYL